MMVDSTEIHEALNKIAIKCHHDEFKAMIGWIEQFRKSLNDIEAETACRNVQFKYAKAIEGLKDR